MAVTRLVLTIDRLRLHGVPREDAPALVAALQRELEHALAGQHEWSSAALAELRPDRVRVAGGPQQLGRALGRAMAGELAR